MQLFMEFRITSWQPCEIINFQFAEHRDWLN